MEPGKSIGGLGLLHHAARAGGVAPADYVPLGGGPQLALGTFSGSLK